MPPRRSFTRRQLLLAVGFVCLIVVHVLSEANKTKKKKGREVLFEPQGEEFAADFAENEPPTTERRRFRRSAARAPAMMESMASTKDVQEEGAPPEEESTAAEEVKPPTQDRMLARTAQVSMTTSEDVGAVLATVEALVEKKGGFVASSSTFGDERFGRGARATLRVPVDAFRDVVRSLATIGQVTASSESVVDVTSDFVDVSARVKTLEASRDQLYKLLQDAQTVKDVLAVRQEITRLTQEIEARQSRLASLANTATLSTVHVDLTQAPLPRKKGGSQTIWHHLVLKAGLSWPHFVRRRFVKAVIWTQTVFGVTLKILLTALAYALAASPLLLAAYFLGPYCRDLATDLIARADRAVLSAGLPSSSSSSSSFRPAASSSAAFSSAEEGGASHRHT